MNKSQLIAERKLWAIAANGAELELHFGIGKPYAVSEQEWACPVILHGLHSDLRDVHGMDSWQAMQLAYQLIVDFLRHFVEDGGQLFWGEGDEEVLLAELVPKATSRDNGTYLRL